MIASFGDPNQTIKLYEKENKLQTLIFNCKVKIPWHPFKTLHLCVGYFGLSYYYYVAISAQMSTVFDINTFIFIWTALLGIFVIVAATAAAFDGNQIHSHINILWLHLLPYMSAMNEKPSSYDVVPAPPLLHQCHCHTHNFPQWSNLKFSFYRTLSCQKKTSRYYVAN